MHSLINHKEAKLKTSRFLFRDCVLDFLGHGGMRDVGNGNGPCMIGGRRTPIALRVLTRCHMRAILNTYYARQRNQTAVHLSTILVQQPSQAKLAQLALPSKTSKHTFRQSLADPRLRATGGLYPVASRGFAPTPEHEWTAMGYPIHTNQIQSLVLNMTTSTHVQKITRNLISSALPASSAPCPVVLQRQF